MSKICSNPNCSASEKEYDDTVSYCLLCGSTLIQKKATALNLGDGNAISGGVNINQSKNITSNNMHYHSTTVHERVKSDSELKLEAANQVRAKANEIMAQYGHIDSSAIAHLRSMGIERGIDNETFRSIIKEVRANHDTSALGLSLANERYRLLAEQAVQSNDIESLSRFALRLEAMAEITQDESVLYLHYLCLSIFNPSKCIELYENQIDENYWRSFWTIISYIRNGRFREAERILTYFDPTRYNKSDEDRNMLEALLLLIQGDKEGAKDFLDLLIDEVSPYSKPILCAIESVLYQKESGEAHVQFYIDHVIVKPNIEGETIDKINEDSSTAKTIDKLPEDVQPSDTKLTIDLEGLYNSSLLSVGKDRFGLLLKAAELGHAQAQFEVACAIAEGNEEYGCTKNIFEATKWLEKAASQRHSLAHLALAALFLHIEIEENMKPLIARDYSKGETELLASANEGNEMAMLYLSKLYLQEFCGSDPIKPEEAFKWAMKCATIYQNDEAERMLGWMYVYGRGTKQDHKQALVWYSRAAEKGDAVSMNSLGVIYRSSKEVGVDLVKAFEWFKKAAEAEDVDGMYNLAVMYSNGYGCEKDMSLAEKWLAIAAENGNERAKKIIDERKTNENAVKVKDEEGDESTYCLYLLSAGSTPQKIIKNIAEILEIDKKEAKEEMNNIPYELMQDEESLKVHLAFSSLVHSGAIVEIKESFEDWSKIFWEKLERIIAIEEYEKAVIYYKALREVSEWEDCDEDYLGQAITLMNTTVEKAIDHCKKKELSKAIKILRPFANTESQLSKFWLAFILIDGPNVGNKNKFVNLKEGFSLYKELADSGHQSAMANVGWCYENGKGTQADVNKALKWYQKALDNGYQMDEWIKNRIDKCHESLNPYGEITRAWVTNEGQFSIAIHANLNINNLENKNCTLKTTFYVDDSSSQSLMKGYCSPIIVEKYNQLNCPYKQTLCSDVSCLLEVKDCHSFIKEGKRINLYCIFELYYDNKCLNRSKLSFAISYQKNWFHGDTIICTSTDNVEKL